MLSNNPKTGRPRTRTFLGCLTCRRRKVKCDCSRPKCRNCERLKLSCQGYERHLRWLTEWSPAEDSDIHGDETNNHSGRMRMEIFSC